MQRKLSKTAPRVAVVSAATTLLLLLVLLGWARTTTSSSLPQQQSSSIRRAASGFKVFTAFSDDAVAAKKRRDFAGLMEHVDLKPDQQLAFLKYSKSCVLDATAPNALPERYQAFLDSKQPHLAQELWKYCALHEHGGLYVDAPSPLLHALEDLKLDLHQPVAVTTPASVFGESIHGALLLLPTPRSKVAHAMMRLLTETPVSKLRSSPLLIPRSLHDAIQHDSDNQWKLLRQECSIDPVRTKPSATARTLSTDSSSLFIAHHCPTHGGYCCQIYDDTSVVMMTKHPLLPYQVLPSASELPLPFDPSAGFYEEADLPYISTISQVIHEKPSDLLTPNFFDTLVQSNCLPSDLPCSNCLRVKDGANCETCKHVCGCYCKTLCNVSVEPKFVSKELTVKPPLYARDGTRLVPRMVHQTWYEPVTREKYPNQSRLIESFKQSGWEYKFYTDDVARDFLKTHFPVEVLEAYDALLPGAFRADLFRYCVLLIYGGVYADMDVMLESNLDAAIGPDVGFMVPVDEPGKPVGHRMCLWNGLIAAAPGHPFLAKVIETVVNNVRNRFTSVDVDAMFCPSPELSVLHAFDTLFTAGPCILGSTLNAVLGRHGQAPFGSGEVKPWEEPTQRKQSIQGTAFVKGLEERSDDLLPLRIPGRTIILHQDKWDMGAHRFTLQEKNLVVAATDMPDYDDRKNLDDDVEHYSNTHVKAGIYGLEKLYKDSHKANEDVRIYVDGTYALDRVQV